MDLTKSDFFHFTQKARKLADLLEMLWLGWLRLYNLSIICRNRTSWKICKPQTNKSYTTHLLGLWNKSEQVKTAISNINTEKKRLFLWDVCWIIKGEPGAQCLHTLCMCVCALFTPHIRAFAIGITLIYVLSLRGHFPFFSFWLELKSMVTQLQNVDLSTDVWLLKCVWGALYKCPIRGSIRAVTLLIADYGPIKARQPVPGVLFCREAILHIGKEHQCSLRCLTAVYWLSTREQSQPFGSYSSFQTVLR